MKKESTPLVSIIIPVYNGSNYMRQAIDSALAQTYKNKEILVINDGSTDNTDEIAKSYGKKIRYYKKPNGGVSSALNLGIEKMHGEYFSWLSHDDMYLPNKVQSEISYLSEKKMLGKKCIAYSDFCLVDENNKHIIDAIADHATTEKKPEYALLRGLINGNSLLIPKKAFDTYGGFDTKLRCVQDYQKWYEMQNTYLFIHVPEILVQSRYHSKQVSNTSPLVRTEGNEFWTRMIKETSDKTKKRLNGNLYAFYYHMAAYLKASPYDEAYKYCEEQLKKLPEMPVGVDNYRAASPDMLSKYKVVRFCQFLKYEGVKGTCSRIINKIKKCLHK